jgi:hypothetical protein
VFDNATENVYGIRLIRRENLLGHGRCDENACKLTLHKSGVVLTPCYKSFEYTGEVK